MRLAELCDRAVNWPSQRSIIFAIALAILLIGVGFALSFAKRVWFGRGIGFLGLCLLMASLFAMRERTMLEENE